MKTETKNKAKEKPAPFQTIPNASKITGLSGYYLRDGCKDGTIPHIMCGRIYYINMPKLMELLGVDDWF